MPQTESRQSTCHALRLALLFKIVNKMSKVLKLTQVGKFNEILLKYIFFSNVLILILFKLLSN